VNARFLIWVVVVMTLVVPAIAQSSPPNIQYEFPSTAAGQHSQDWIAVNVSATDDNGIGILQIFLYNTSGQINSTSSNTSPLFINFTGLSYGTYTYNATVNDTDGQINSTISKEIILGVKDLAGLIINRFWKTWVSLTWL
jgi:hypothetical protein